MTDPKAMPAALRALLERPNFVHLSTLRADGSPKVDPIWADVSDDHTIVIGSGRTSLKTRNVLRDPRVALSVVDMANPYEEGQVRGVASVVDDPDMAVMDRISHKYIGAPFPTRDDPANRIAIVITVTQCRYAKLPFSHTPPTT
jgi:PPOX class probable F420-dependent enzyme